MLNYKQNITEIPNYLDGYLELFQINQDDQSDCPLEYLTNLNEKIFFEEISISDKLKYELNSRNQNIYIKVRIPQYKKIGSLNAVKINKKFYKVFNAYHFVNKDGYLQSDLTLEEYPNPKFEVNNND
jgi:hypothetical protein